MSNYVTGKICQNVYYINDDLMCTVYLLIGENKALVIDTGIDENKSSLLDEIRKITDKELVVILTHSHFDHIGHLYEFNKCLVAKEELAYAEIKNYELIKNEQIIDLGNYSVKVLITPGHTPGSLVIIDEANSLIFTGDEFGSGCGMWLQLPNSLPVSIYRDSLKKFLSYLKDNYNKNIYDWKLWGGHYGQEKTGLLGFNPLNIQLVENLIILCDKILNNEVEFEKTNAKAFCNEASYYVKYKTAEMIIRKSLVK